MAELITEKVALGVLYPAADFGSNSQVGDLTREFNSRYLTNSISYAGWYNGSINSYYVTSQNVQINGFVVSNYRGLSSTLNYQFSLKDGVVIENLNGTDSGDRRIKTDFLIISDQQSDEFYFDLEGLADDEQLCQVAAPVRFWTPRYNYVLGTQYQVVDTNSLQDASGSSPAAGGVRFRRVDLRFSSLTEEDFKELHGLITVAGKRYLCYLALHPNRSNNSPPTFVDNYSGLAYISSWSNIRQTNDGYSISITVDLVNRVEDVIFKPLIEYTGS